MKLACLATGHRLLLVASCLLLLDMCRRNLVRHGMGLDRPRLLRGLRCPDLLSLPSMWLCLHTLGMLKRLDLA